MARTRPLLIAGCALLLLAGCTDDEHAAAPPEPTPLENVNQAELVVDLVDGTNLATFLAKYGLKPDQARWNSPNVADVAIAVVRVAAADQAALLAKLNADTSLVEVAENNAILRLPVTPQASAPESSRFIPDDDSLEPLKSFPNDPLYGKQWNMRMIQAREAWRYATGKDVIVAVIDTGVAYEDKKGLWAPDLQRTRFVPGYDFIDDDDIAADDNGHGTHCAGTIAQSTNNGRGVIGLAQQCKIMPLKVLTKQGWGTVSDIADAIRFAADNGAHVISMSLGGGGFSRVLKSACDYAQSKGVVVVAAAGNANRGRVEYPAAYPGNLAVSAVGPSGKRSFYSSYGKQLFIAAPGGDMKDGGVEGGVLQNTIIPDRNKKKPAKTVFAYFQGTSMATPHVAAASALLYETGVTRGAAIGSILATTAKGEGWNKEYGHGVLDAGAAVKHAIFFPGLVSLLFVGLAIVVTIRRTERRDLARPLLVLGGVLGACGLFFLRPLGLGEVPFVGGLLTRGMPDWDIAILGASWHWNAIFASALIPCFLGLLSVPTRVTRSIGVGIVLGWAARLVTGIVLPYADVRWIPGQGTLDGLWLAGNAVVLVMAAAVFVKLGRSKDRRRMQDTL